MSFAPDAKPFAKPETLLRVPVGLASPLWVMFAGAAVSGATWWWMTRWIQPQNLEAMFGAAAELDVSAAPQSQAPAAMEIAPAALEIAPAALEIAAEAPVVDLLGAVLDPALEPAAETAPEPTSEVILETAPEPDPVSVVETIATEAVVLEPVAAEAPPVLSDVDLPSESAANDANSVEPLAATEAATLSGLETTGDLVVEPTPKAASQPGPAVKSKKKVAAPKLDL